MRKDICVEKRGHWKRATNLRESTSGQMSEDLPDIRPDATALPADPSPATRGACDHISFRAGEHLRWFCPLLVLNRFPLVLVIVRLSANSGIPRNLRRETGSDIFRAAAQRTVCASG